jgi:hypothetical protein
MKLHRITSAVGRGLIAGLAGTAAITISTMIEAKLRKRKDSEAPAKVAGKVLGVRPRDAAGKKRFSTLVHWDYGMTWGCFLGIAEAMGVEGAPASAMHFAAVWGAALYMLPAANAAEPVTEWEAEEIAIDVMHHAIYVAVCGLVYSALKSTEESEVRSEREVEKGAPAPIMVADRRLLIP